MSEQAGPHITLRPALTSMRASRALPVTGTDGAELLIDLAGAGLGGAWVNVTWRDAGSGGIARALLSAVSDDGKGAALIEEPLGGDAFAWTGLLPPDVASLRLTALSRTDPFRLRDLTIRRRGRLGIVARAGLRQPGLTAQAVYWRVLGLKVRARGMVARSLAHRPETGYAAWIARFDHLTTAERARIRAEIAGWEAPPLISVLMPVHDPDPRVLEAAIRSVRSQLYPAWELCIADDASTDPRIPRLIARHAAEEPRIRSVRRPENGHIARATNDALSLASGPYAAFLDHDDLLSENALFEVAAAIRADSDLELIYSDEDKVDGRGRRFEPHFKSGYDRELLWAQNYVNHLCVVRTETLRRLGGLRPGFEGSQDHDLLLRLTEGLDGNRVRHIPKVLYHWRAAAGSGTFSDRALARAEDARLQALAEVAERRGARAERGMQGFNRLVRPLPEPPPLVSVIIPTRDRAELLGVVLDGLFARTDYPALEVIVVDNGSAEPATRDLFARYAADPRFRVLPAPGPFNFSELSNRGAAAARGTILLFLNNDIEVLEPGWLTELASIASDPEIGAVGAKLLYPDGTIQHGGIVLGIGGIAGHSHLGLPDREPGYFARMVLSQEVSAVTGACLATRAQVFSEVGGFDAVGLAVAFNDVDLCLKIRTAGYRIVWTPHARLVHHESKSRGAEDTPEKRARFETESRVMRERWEPVLRADPYYNPNLSRAAAHYRL
ncbi:glycosyltransferase family 2 protein [Methylobacterium sp. R2-1]|uniref:glycosyltransferase family 2 protein n=1 Tax=Methylobacterium sp. R2-1 TaxID=2587064 RepID=UPI001619C40B|nr:glycosyltransferase family 2 protein [Methylobacterium sp. R2-1]MBB2962405.1 GT2 family glycosyltransferase [Methylobacterium sp. R2-1]